MWATVGASDNPCSNSYHGPSPFSETITTVISRYTATLDLRLYVDHHCCGDMYLQPYGATDELPSAHEDIDSLGRIGCEATDAVHGRNYCSRQGPIYTTIYPASGSSVDYMYAVNNVTYSYGTEMRSSNGNGPADPVLPASEEMWVSACATTIDGVETESRRTPCAALCSCLSCLTPHNLVWGQAGMTAMALELLQRP
jgi:hypothetical protein